MANYQGDDGDNTIRGSKKGDTIDGGAGNDILFGLAGNDEIDGGSGDDAIDVGTGNDDADGGTGRDTLIFDHADGNSRTKGQIVFEWSKTGYAGVLESSLGKTRFANFEAIEAKLGKGDDSVVFDGAGLAKKASVSIDAGDGTDVLEADFSAVKGLSFVVGQGGTVSIKNSAFRGFEMFDLTLGAGQNTVTAGKLNDVITSAKGGIDTVDGGAGVDTYIFRAQGGAAQSASLTGTGISLANGTTLKNIEIFDLTFGSGDDTFTVTDLATTPRLELSLGAGNDRLIISSDSTLFTLNSAGSPILLGDGADVVEMIGSKGSSATVDGGTGADTFRFAAAFGRGTYIGGTDAAIDVLNADFNGIPSGSAGVSGTIDADTNGLFGTIANGNAGVKFAEIEDAMLLLGRGADSVSITRAAIESGLAIALDGNAGTDVLTVDLSGRPDSVFVVNADNTISSTIGRLANFETFRLTLAGGSNRITTGSGADTIVGAGGFDTVNGGAGKDSYSTAFTADDAITLSFDGVTGAFSNGVSLAGIETLSLVTGAGDDGFTLGGGTATIDSGGGADVFTVTAGILTARGGDGEDRFTLGGGTATIDGGGGADVFTVTAGILTAIGGDGDDRFSVNIAPSTPFATVNLDGGAGSDTFELAGRIAFTLRGGDDDGVDSVSGGDIYTLSADANGLTASVGQGGFSGFESFSGRLQDIDRAAIGSGWSISASGLNYLNGLIRIDYSEQTDTSFVVDENGAITADRVSLHDFRQYELTLGAGDNHVSVVHGKLVINSTGGADIVDAGDNGEDSYNADFSGAATALTYDFGANGSLNISNGTMVQDFEYFSINAGSGDDRIVTNVPLTPVRPDIWFDGGGGNDRFEMMTGLGARLFGGAGDDTFVTGKVYGGFFTGGAGADTFAFTALVRYAQDALIFDFSHAEGDRIDLSAIDPDLNLAGDQAFTFIGTASFTPGTSLYELRVGFNPDTGRVQLEADVNHDGNYDLAISFFNEPTLVVSDLVL